jgi:HSP20 family protein
MTLVKTNYRPANGFGNLLNEFFTDFPAVLEKSGINFPPTNIVETAEGYHLELNVPGRNKEDFKVTIENGLLVISYEKKEEVNQEGVKSIRKEFDFQSFKRSFNLDDKIASGDIQAKYENGLLKLFLPKKPEVKETAKQVTIQ